MTQAWYPFYWSDYSGKTMHLTQGQHGAYMLFLRWIYTTGKPIPDKQRYSIARAMVEQEMADADAVLSEFFTLHEGVWSNDRASNVMDEQEIKHQRRVNAGKMGGEAKASNAKPMPENSSSNQNQNQIGNSNELPSIPEQPKPAPPDLFPEFWAIYPRKVGKAQAEKAYHNAIKKGEISHAALINAVTKLAAAHAAAQTEEQFIPHAGTWLAKKRWTDDLSGLYRRTKGPNTAPNARGSQFSATKSAAAKLIQGLGGLPGAVGGPDSVPTWPNGAQDALPAPGDRADSYGVQAYSDPGDPAGGSTIDHCDVSPADGGEAFLRCQ